MESTPEKFEWRATNGDVVPEGTSGAYRMLTLAWIMQQPGFKEFMATPEPIKIFILKEASLKLRICP